MEFDDFDDLFGTENLEENEDEEDPTNGKGIRDNGIIQLGPIFITIFIF
jgi:hypothetical protein